jgi:hypothetical protein
MSVISGLGYLAVGVSDLDEAVEYYSRFVRLDVTERTARSAFMSDWRKGPATGSSAWATSSRTTPRWPKCGHG